MRSICLALAVCLALPSCATTTGTLAGPVTVPLGFWHDTHGLPTWGKVCLFPFSALLGPFVGFAEGLRCDVGFAQNFAYGVDGHPRFSRVFTPVSPERDA